MKKAADAYALVVAYKRIEWTLASFYRRGFLLERFANTVVEAPIPPEVKRLGEEAVASYQDQLGTQAAQLEDKAVEAYTATLDQAKKNRILNNEWIHKTLESLNRFRPKEYPLLKEPKSSLAFDTTYQPRLADTPEGPSTPDLPKAPAPEQQPQQPAPAPAPADSASSAKPGAKPEVKPASAKPDAKKTESGSKVKSDEK